MTRDGHRDLQSYQNGTVSDGAVFFSANYNHQAGVGITGTEGPGRTGLAWTAVPFRRGAR